MRFGLSCAIAAVLLVAGCGEEDDPLVAPPTAEEPSDGSADGAEDPSDGGAGEAPQAGGGSGDPAAEREREARRVALAYIAAIDARDGARICRLLAPGALADITLPRSRGSCAASLEASIGYRDPRGFPQFAGVTVSGPSSTRATPGEARATVPIVTEFADRDQPSVEDDLVYLVREGGRYRVAKASTVLYRAVGIAEIPPRVISPP